jgi:hypothetical protein
MAAKIVVFVEARRIALWPLGADATATLLLAPKSCDLLALQPEAGHQPLLPKNECVNVGLERGRRQ